MKEYAIMPKMVKKQRTLPKMANDTKKRKRRKKAFVSNYNLLYDDDGDFMFDDDGDKIVE